MQHRCVECGFRVKRLFVQYSPGNIRLMKCENCKSVADEYIECEFMIILIDLILHKPKAYRHLLYNVLNQETVPFEGLLWKCTVCFLVLDAWFVVEVHRLFPRVGCLSLLLKINEEDCGSSVSFSSLVWICQEMFMDVIVGNFIFLCVFLLSARVFLDTLIGNSRFRDILIAVLVSSYFKIFLIAMMVWEFPSSVIFIIDLFVLSSNIVSVKVITDSPMNRCIGTCFCAHAAKLLVKGMPNLRSLNY